MCAGAKRTGASTLLRVRCTSCCKIDIATPLDLVWYAQRGIPVRRDSPEPHVLWHVWIDVPKLAARRVQPPGFADLLREGRHSIGVRREEFFHDEPSVSGLSAHTRPEKD
eukprot:TRINITY_DN287_c0_g2_i1.p3 TRINITY_DN287_c0_g2~~TRINITY_DN287_c0_g2_i1.p3  ORF type:complete len:110 (+),score=6.33 TRINITY_DN287_c0_g2_i1:432-761(+)